MKITAQNLIRWSGPAVMIAGLSYALVGVFHPPNIVSSVTSMPWLMVLSSTTWPLSERKSRRRSKSPRVDGA